MRGDLADLARRQHAIFSVGQASEAGVSPRSLAQAVQRGELTIIRRGVYAVAAAPGTYEQTVLAAILAAGHDAWASHRTAARMHGLAVPQPDGIDVLTLSGRRLRLPGVHHRRSTKIRLADLVRVRGVPATTIARTLVDCLPWLGERGFARAVDDARRRGLVSVEEIESAHGHLDGGRRTGRRLVVPARRPIAVRSAGQLAGGSERELDVLGVLAAAGLPAPVQQFRVALESGPRFLDYAYPDLLVGLEWDGFAEHGLIRSTFDDDRVRDAELQLLGWLMLHITSATSGPQLVRWVERAHDTRAA